MSATEGLKGAIIPSVTDPLAGLTPEHRHWLIESEGFWREAHAIVASEPHLDVGDVYHVLQNLKLSPAERLRRGLTRVRVRPHAG